MKKIILISLSLMLALTMSAQEKLSRLTFQPKIGMTISTITNAGDNNPRIGMMAGVEIEYDSGTPLGMEFGVHYSMQGDKGYTYYNDGYYIHKATVVEKLDYINIPILGVLHVTDGLSLKIGVQAGFNVLARIKASAAGQSAEVGLKKLGVNTETFDFAVPVGLSYTFKNGLVFEGRYNIGVSEIINKTDMRNGVFQFSIGYKADI